MEAQNKAAAEAASKEAENKAAAPEIILDLKEQLKQMQEITDETVKSKQNTEKALKLAEEAAASQAEKILVLEKELLSMKARETPGVAGMPDQTEEENISIRQAHDKFVEACSLLLDKLQVGVESVAVESDHPAWESISNMSKIMTTLSELQLFLLAKGKTLSIPNIAELTSQEKMKLVMLDLQRIIFIRPNYDDDGKLVGGRAVFLPLRNLRSDKMVDASEMFDCVEWIDKIVESGILPCLESKLIKRPASALIKIADGGMSNATSEFPCRLDGNKDGLFVPWGTQPAEKPAATTDEMRKADSSKVDEQPQEEEKAGSSGVDDKLQEESTDEKRKGDSLAVGGQPLKKQKVGSGPERDPGIPPLGKIPRKPPNPTPPQKPKTTPATTTTSHTTPTKKPGEAGNPARRKRELTPETPSRRSKRTQNK